jgi:hypothetical protein
MKYKIIILLIGVRIFSACNNSCEETVIVTYFPKTGELKAKVQKIPVSILLPRAMIISGDQLFIYKEKEENLFEVFNLPDCKYLCSTGRRGQGPDDFLQLDTRSFQATENGFKIMETGTGRLKTVVFENNRLFISHSENIFDNPSNNGFYPLADSLFLVLGNPGEQNEYSLYDKKNGKQVAAGNYPQWTDGTIEPMQLIFTYIKNCVVSPDRKKFVAFYGRFKRLRIYDHSVKLLHDIEVDIEPYKSNKNQDASNQGEYYFGQPQAIGNYIYVLCSNSFENFQEASNTCELQVWDWNGNPIAGYRFDRDISAIAISEKYKQIYAVNKQVDDELYMYDIPD